MADSKDNHAAGGISRATAVKTGAVGLLGGLAAVFARSDAADAAASNNSFTAVNNGGSDLASGFQTQSGSQGFGYTTGGLFTGTSTGVEGHSLRGNGVAAYSYGLAAGAAGAALYAQGLAGGNAIYAEATDANTAAEAIQAVADGSGNGVTATSGSGSGLAASSTSGDGVTATSGSGNGLSATITSLVTDDVAASRATNSGTGKGLWAQSNGGVCVHADDRSVSAEAYGVYAQSPSGTAVYGDSSDGTGVWADTFDGTALVARGQFGTAIDVQGQAKFNTSGIATVKGTVANPKSSVRVTITATTLTASSLVLATIQTNNAPGTYVQSAVPNIAGGYVTINLNQAVSNSVKVAWFVVN
jgi:hypothetical protein